MKPTELAVVLNVKGDQKVVLTRQEDIIKEKSYERRRRYRDILKNYYIGVWASLNITKDLVIRCIKKLF